MKPEDIVNNALNVMGHPNRIFTFWDGEPEAVAARDMWVQVRDAQFTVLQPDWARWDVALIPAKTAPIAGTEWTDEYPDMPWHYEYALPDDCLVPLAIKPRPPSVWRPRAMRFRIKTSDGVYTLLGDDPAPVLSCIHSVPDTEIWHNDFIDSVTETLAKRLAALFGKAMPRQRPQTEGAADADNPG